MKNITIAIFILMFSVSLFAQDTKNIGSASAAPSKASKWFFEAQISLSGGTISHIGITPLIGYKATPTIHLGATLSYFHGWDKTNYDNPTQSNLFGGSVFMRWVPIKEFFLLLEPAIYTYKVFTDITTNEEKGVPFVFLGAGFNYYINPKLFLIFQVKVDVLNSDKSPYKDSWHPIFNAGIGFGI